MRLFITVLLLLLLSVVVLTSCTSSPPSQTRSASYVVAGDIDEGRRWRDNRFIATHPDTEALGTDGVHDPQNEAIATLQEPAEALGAFPIDRRGAIDWVKALDLGIIEPRADLEGKTEMDVLDMDIMFKNTGQMPWVRFPHSTHSKWLDCTNCHSEIFLPEKGANKFNMDDILAGEFCGRCHGKVSFTLWVCERCHSVTHPGSPEIWWKSPQ